MTACCPDCGSASTIGSDAVALCTECASVTVAGTSFGAPMIAAAAVAAGLAIVLVRRALRRVETARPTPIPA